MRKKIAMIIALTTLLIITFSYYITAQSIYSLYYPMTATVIGSPRIRLYSDPGMTTEMLNGTTIDWNKVKLGTNQKTVYIKNDGNCDVTLVLRTQNLPSGWTLTWDDTGSILAIGQSRTVTLTLSIPQGTAKGTYNWSSWIEAVEVT